jgi:membrane-associated phospholipid phosphatase
VITAVTAEEGTFWDSQIRSGWIQVESVVLGVGASQLLKRALSRPRPYAYLDEASRPDDAHYDVTRDDAFVSMPSGHATVAWSSTMTGMTLLVLERPDLPFLGHFAGGFVAGALATSTSVLRVEGEVHHPTDVLAGAALGSAVGIGVPLLHDRGSDTSRGPAWKAALLGLAAGTAASLLVVPRL